MGNGVTNLSGLSELMLLAALVGLALMLLIIVIKRWPQRVRRERPRYLDQAFPALVVICLAALVVLLLHNAAQR